MHMYKNKYTNEKEKTRTAHTDLIAQLEELSYQNDMGAEQIKFLKGEAEAKAFEAQRLEKETKRQAASIEKQATLGLFRSLNLKESDK